MTIAELESMFKKLCTDGRITQSEVHTLLKVADKDKSGTITFDVSKLLITKISISKGNYTCST